MNFQRIVQGVSLALFFLALGCAASSLHAILPVDGFLRMDPTVFLGTLVAGRVFVPFLWVSGLVLVLSVLLGRFFCSCLCPMGATIDCTDHLLRKRRKKRNRRLPIGRHSGSVVLDRPLRRLKYYVLFFIIGAGALGVSFVFLASPLSLITRFYVTILYPAFSFFAARGVDLLRPLADTINLTSLAYAVVKVPRYHLQWVTLLFLLSIFLCGLWSPRFWCRYLCPSGALFALFASRPVFRRQVSGNCNQCGLCIRNCPMGAIGNPLPDGMVADPGVTKHAECISCLACVRGCPTRSVSFALPCTAAHPGPAVSAGPETPPEKLFRDRRRILGAGLSGAATAVFTFTGLASPHSETGPGSILHPAMIRPPGAMPETDFLARCIRCGECLQACPTNSLQPLGMEAGLTGFFSPVITPRRGPCEPGCNACGLVCPTRAIPPLPLMEKQKAKVGTARISRQKCLAWELEKKCLICDEVCPYDAVEFRKYPGMKIVVPFVNENKCAGCGYCEHYCPVRAIPAIVVEPMLALRLSGGSYRTAAGEMGYSLEVRAKAGNHAAGSEQGDAGRFQLDEDGLPPGFTK